MEDNQFYTYQDYLGLAFGSAPSELADKILQLCIEAARLEAARVEEMVARHDLLNKLVGEAIVEAVAADIPVSTDPVAEASPQPVEVEAEESFKLPADVTLEIEKARETWSFATANGLICRAKETPNLPNGRKPLWVWAALKIAEPIDKASIKRIANRLMRDSGQEGASPEDVEQVVAFAEMRIQMLEQQG